MTQREDALIELLRDSFEDTAGFAPEADLTDPVLRRGRRARTRRRAGVAVVGAAAVAAGVALGVTLTPGAPQGAGPIATGPTRPTPSATPSPQPTTPTTPSVTPSSRPPSPPTTPSSSESPWPPAGPPRLVRYPGQGITVTGPGQVHKLHGTSRAFRDFVAASVPTGSPGCGSGSITIRAWRSDGYAIGDVFDCPGGEAAIFGAPDGTWRLLTASQALWSCHALRTWSVPSAIAGDTCEGPTGARPYHQ